MRLLIVGQNPGIQKTNDPREIPIHRKLCEWMDRAGVYGYSFVNAQHRQGNYAPSLVDMNFLCGCVCCHHGPILVLGDQAWSTMQRIFGPTRAGAMRGPHPSGLNRKLNDPKYVDAFIDCLQLYIRKRTNAIYRLREDELQSMLYPDSDTCKKSTG